MKPFNEMAHEEANKNIEVCTSNEQSAFIAGAKWAYEKMKPYLIFPEDGNDI